MTKVNSKKAILILAIIPSVLVVVVEEERELTEKEVSVLKKGLVLK